MSTPNSSSHRPVWLLLTVSALGYFVDVFDLLLFSVVRTQSLTDLGVAKENILGLGLNLLNWQMGGILLGGFCWGILGDKRGRRSVLFGSIILYSLANLGNSFAHSVGEYEIWRFLAGFGLAGELGAGVTLVTECMSTKRRGLGAMLIVVIGVPGAACAAWVGTHFDWRIAYCLGGGMGLALLLLRFGVQESGLYTSLRQTDTARGSLRLIFSSSKRTGRFLLCVLSGLQAYFVIGILITLAPEFGQAFHLDPVPVAGQAIIMGYLGLTMGSLLCNGLSQWMGRRKPAFFIFHGLSLASILVYIYWAPASLDAYYGRCVFLGMGLGFWAILNTNAAEQFGTNLRATVTTAVPNLIRGAQIPIAWAFTHFRVTLGIINSAALVGVVCVLVAITAVSLCRETFDRPLDFVEV